MEPLKVAGNLASLDVIAQYVIAAAEAANLDRKASYRLRLAVDEITTNIITYGYQDADREGVIELKTEINDNDLIISIEDTGIPFDPSDKLAQEMKTIYEPLDQRPIGKLGIYLAIQGVDQFLYERVGDHNRNILVVNRPSIVS